MHRHPAFAKKNKKIFFFSSRKHARPHFLKNRFFVKIRKILSIFGKTEKPHFLGELEDLSQNEGSKTRKVTFFWHFWTLTFELENMSHFFRFRRKRCSRLHVFFSLVLDRTKLAVNGGVGKVTKIDLSPIYVFIRRAPPPPGIVKTTLRFSGRNTLQNTFLMYFENIFMWNKKYFFLFSKIRRDVIFFLDWSVWNVTASVKSNKS